MACAVSVRPEPSRPARPTTSPRVHVDADAGQRVPAGQAVGPQHRARRPRRVCSVAEAWCAPCSRTSATSRPSIVATSPSRSVSATGPLCDPAAVAQDGDLLAEPEHLVQLVRHVEHRDAARRAACSITSASRSTSRGSSDDVGSSMITTRASVDTRAGDRDHLLHAERRARRAAGGRRRRCRSGPAVSRAARCIAGEVDQAEPVERFPAEEQVARHAHQSAPG